MIRSATCVLLFLFMHAQFTLGQAGSLSIVSLPYFDNFDSGPNLWTFSVKTGGTFWLHGDPTFGSSYSNPNCWRSTDSLGQGGYASESVCYLYSPLFKFQGSSTGFSSSPTANTELSFWQNSYCENNWDGFRLEYRIYSAAESPWHVLGSVAHPLSSNWYSNTNIISSDLPGWSGTTLGWLKSSIILSELNNVSGLVQFRFVFTSDGSVQMTGPKIDNFCLDPPNITPRLAAPNSGLRVNVYPNPATEYLQIELLNASALRSNFILYNKLGELILQEYFDARAHIVNRKGIPPGLYSYVISNSQGTNRGKILFK